MRVAVYGLWHLGSVTAACLADGGHHVVGIDPDPATIAGLQAGKPPVAEPGLDALIRAGLAAGRLRFAEDRPESFAGIDLLWVTFDTPVDEDDVSDVGAVTGPVLSRLPALPDGCLVLVSSQLPVGTTRELVAAAAGKGLTFGYSPENLRLGKAIEVFTRPDRVIVGLEREIDRGRVSELLKPFTANIRWMSLESAEMTKHAINAFLATSVVFMNEIAAICETVGADAKEVEIGLKSEARIGPGAYLSPGAAFAGGTLARDVSALTEIGKRRVAGGPLLPAVLESNRRHALWALGKIRDRFSDLAGRRIAILGLTYKPGTDTLRRSSAVELARRLAVDGARVAAFDPSLTSLPDDLAREIDLAPSPAEAMRDASAMVLATPWPELRKLEWKPLIAGMSHATIIDAGWVLAPALRDEPTVDYFAVGLPARKAVGHG
ncbi:MAG TPA: nucleotide sugar dehydrogenase [Bauldia sp.]|nr:nucleotide sugar dehydrogenase [Bauldia sp.]